MTPQLVFATNNEHKLREVREILSGRCRVLSLAEAGIHEELPETSPTLEGNALQKARRVAELCGMDCFADDTGLEVTALGGEPGVMSARYASANEAGGSHDSQANMRLLLKKMAGATDRSARFRTAIALIRGGKETVVEGTVYGHITEHPSGTDGFGYDPVFRPEESNVTFAEMAPEEKNAISHRGRAIANLLRVLENETHTTL